MWGEGTFQYKFSNLETIEEANVGCRCANSVESGRVNNLKTWVSDFLNDCSLWFELIGLEFCSFNFIMNFSSFRGNLVNFRLLKERCNSMSSGILLTFDMFLFLLCFLGSGIFHSPKIQSDVQEIITREDLIPFF